MSEAESMSENVEWSAPLEASGRVVLWEGREAGICG